MTAEAPWPSDIQLRRAESVLEINFESGDHFILDAEYLRVESPSAEVQGHGGAKPPPVAGKRQVRLTGAEPVGNYAIRLLFDDGHSTGLYTWPLLFALGRERETRWPSYLARLAEFGLSREK